MSSKIYIFSILIFLISCKRTSGERNEGIQPQIVIEQNSETNVQEDHSVNVPTGRITLEGKMTRVVDGDTAEFLYNEELPLMIRLQHIDAPEKRGKQPFGNKAKQMLSDLSFGQEVTIITDGEFDMNGRLIGEIINEDGINVNKEMVRLGYAWHFKKYSNDMSYDVLEKEARNAKRGLWQESNPIAPWDFR